MAAAAASMSDWAFLVPPPSSFKPLLISPARKVNEVVLRNNESRDRCWRREGSKGLCALTKTTEDDGDVDVGVSSSTSGSISNSSDSGGGHRNVDVAGFVVDAPSSRQEAAVVDLMASDQLVLSSVSRRHGPAYILLLLPMMVVVDRWSVHRMSLAQHAVQRAWCRSVQVQLAELSTHLDTASPNY